MMNALQFSMLNGLQWYKVFTQINADAKANGQQVVLLTDVEYYAIQISNLCEPEEGMQDYILPEYIVSELDAMELAIEVKKIYVAVTNQFFNADKAIKHKIIDQAYEFATRFVVREVNDLQSGMTYDVGVGGDGKKR
jgi:hypothetical protein